MPIRIVIVAVTAVLGLAVLPGAAVAAPGNSCTPGRDLKYLGQKWSQTVNYYVIRSSLPAASSDTRRQDRLIARARNGAGTWNSGKNDCHFPALHGFTTSFAGDSGASASNHNDGRNTIDFGTGDIGCGTGAGLNACTYTRLNGVSVGDYFGRNRSRTVEFDMRFNTTGHTYYSGMGLPCAGCFDTWGLAAHEWGHVVGLDDLGDRDKNGYQTMYGALNIGESYGRTLGRSDWLGLKGLYGP
jgi:hypothetical protein